ncbi:hypothetical protein [Aestuariimicrobium ganziense]|uniref:hypothetical protein n=1 Tax=Aestuariimicrobium ganziense TaxID=2773677 RepID=UPI001945387D|nr:hypothetical protein [Aestuariimicrobium ganziense]
MSTDEHAKVSIESFEPPRNRAPWIITLVVALVVLGLAFAAYLASRQPEAPTPTPTPVVTPSATPTEQASHDPNTIPFHSERDDADGIWRILGHRWTDKGLELTMSIEVTRGTFEFMFFCLDNATTDDYNPSPSGANSLNEGMVREGETVQGIVIFDKPRGDTTVILADGRGRQITALVATG